jgi:hypothetical protein
MYDSAITVFISEARELTYSAWRVSYFNDSIHCRRSRQMGGVWIQKFGGIFKIRKFIAE